MFENYLLWVCIRPIIQVSSYQAILQKIRVFWPKVVRIEMHDKSTFKIPTKGRLKCMHGDTGTFLLELWDLLSF